MDRATEICVAGREALDRAPGVDVVYLHNAEGNATCAVVTLDWLGYVGSHGVRPDAPMLSHDHIEPGMF